VFQTKERLLPLAAAALALLLILTSFTFTSLPARAASGFPVNLSQVGQGDLLTTANGSVTIRGGSSGSTDAFETFAQDGSVAAEVPLSSTIASTGASAVDVSTSTLYMSVFDTAGIASVAAFNGSTTTWSTQLTTSCAATGQTLILNPEALVVGADGNVYVTTSQTCAGGNVYFLSKLDNSTGSLVFQQQLSSLPAWLGAFNGGVIIQVQHVAIQYIGFDGSLLASDPIDLAGDFTELARANTTDGKVAVIFWKYPSSSVCAGYNGQYVTRVVEYSPSGIVFSYVPTSCEYLMPMVITSNGMTVATGNDANQTPQLVALDPAGNLLKTVPLANDTGKYTSLTADVNGQVLLAYHDQQSGDQAGYEFELLDSGLNQVASYNTLQLDPTGQTDFENLQIGLSNGRLYLALDNCSKFGCTSSTARFLYAQDMAGLGIDYPRGALAPSGQPTPTPSPSPTPAPGLSVKIALSPEDPLLLRQVTFSASGNVARYQFAWAQTAHGVTPGTLKSCSARAVSCNLDFSAPDPGTTWNLMARTVDGSGKAGMWFVQGVKIPAYIYTMVFGDSISSGHHRDHGGATGQTTCDDAGYSYGLTVWQNRQQQLPDKWKKVSLYLNFAHSGFSTGQIIDNAGADEQNACKQTIDAVDAPLSRMVYMLQHNSGSWNLVVGSAGIDDTNWSAILPNILVERDKIQTRAQCQAYVNKWTLLTSQQVRSDISSSVAYIVQQLRQADPDADLKWLGYYNVAGTGSDVAPFTHVFIPEVCKKPFDDALQTLHSLILGAIGSSGVSFVDSNKALGGRDDLLQDLYVSDKFWQLSGWPHPNQKGQKVIAQLVGVI